MNTWCCSVIILVLCLAIPLNAQAFEPRYSRAGSVIHWERAEFPIHYYIDSNPAMPEGAVEAVIRAFQRWENVGPARPSFAFRGLIDAPGVALDGKNCIIWVEENWRYGEEAIAHATTWHDLEDGSILNCDIELNARDYEWSTELAKGTLDIQNVVVHEIGHLLGLDDVFNSLDGTMFGFILTNETKKRSLEGDDIMGTTFLYPLSATFEEICASLINTDDQSLSPLLPPQDTPGGTNITLISSCDWERDGTAGEIAAVSYEAESGFTFHVYRLPDTDKGEKDISTLAEEDWLIASGDNARGMAVVDADGDGFRDDIAILKDNAEGDSFINIYKFSRTADAPSLTCSIYLGKADHTTHMARTKGNEICLLKKVNGRDYNLSLYKLDIAQEELYKIEDYGELPIEPDEEVLSLFPFDEEPGKTPSLGILIIDERGNARIDFMEPTPDGEIANSLSIQLPGSSPVLATTSDTNGDGLSKEIILITE